MVGMFSMRMAAAMTPTDLTTYVRQLAEIGLLRYEERVAVIEAATRLLLVQFVKEYGQHKAECDLQLPRNRKRMPDGTLRVRYVNEPEPLCSCGLAEWQGETK